MNVDWRVGLGAVVVIVILVIIVYRTGPAIRRIEAMLRECRSPMTGRDPPKRDAAKTAGTASATKPDKGSTPSAGEFDL